jgi:Mor family transcriptional regulator
MADLFFLNPRTMKKLVEHAPDNPRKQPDSVEKVESDDLAGEIWRYVPNSAFRYEVSNFGRVRSHFQAGEYLERPILLDPSPPLFGYPTIQLKIGSDWHTLRLGELVLDSFTGPSIYAVEYIDGDRRNNRLDNLRYAKKLKRADQRQQERDAKNATRIQGGERLRPGERRKRFIQKRNQEIIVLFEEQGATLGEIASRYGMGEENVRVILRRSPNHYTRPYSNSANYKQYHGKRAQEILSLYDTGITLNKIAKRCEVSVATVRRILLSYGKTTSRSRRSPDPPKKVSERPPRYQKLSVLLPELLQSQEVRDLVEAKVPLGDIAKRFNLSTTAAFQLTKMIKKELRLQRDAEMRALHEGGMAINDIARQYNLTIEQSWWIVDPDYHFRRKNKLHSSTSPTADPL